jgi:hypothetical protein
MAFYQAGSVEIILPASVEVLGEECLPECSSLSSVTFESGSRLSRIESGAFTGTGLIEIILPASIEVLGENCLQTSFMSSPRCITRSGIKPPAIADKSVKKTFHIVKNS